MLGRVPVRAPGRRGQAYERHREALAEEAGSTRNRCCGPCTSRSPAGDERSHRGGGVRHRPARGPGGTARRRAAAPAPRAAGSGRPDQSGRRGSWLLRRSPARRCRSSSSPARRHRQDGTGAAGRAGIAATGTPTASCTSSCAVPAGGAAGIARCLRSSCARSARRRCRRRKAERLAEYRTLLADRRVLVVLDDAASGAQVSDLVPGNPAARCWSPRSSGCPKSSGAHHVAPLEPLEPADATELFQRMVTRAPHQPGETTRRPSDRVVALCGGLPLALRIAGALRVRRSIPGRPPNSPTGWPGRDPRRRVRGTQRGAHDRSRASTGSARRSARCSLDWACCR